MEAESLSVPLPTASALLKAKTPMIAARVFIVGFLEQRFRKKHRMLKEDHAAVIHLYDFDGAK